MPIAMVEFFKAGALASFGHNGNYGHNPRVVSVVTVVTGGRLCCDRSQPAGCDRSSRCDRG